MKKLAGEQKYALISVFDKSGVVELARALVADGFTILSTGGTATELAKADVPVTAIEQFTGFSATADGRVKTLHPKIYTGILDQSAPSIQIVVCNLYPFEKTVAKAGVTDSEAVENIDIGGVTLLRAAAKNFALVTPIVDPADYAMLAERLQSEKIDLALRKRLALKAFQHTAQYDRAISAYFGDKPSVENFPQEILHYRQLKKLRYGENPHQTAYIYGDSSTHGLPNATQLHGSDLSYLNYRDADAALRAAGTFADNAVVIIKHLTPCGIAVKATQADAFTAAFDCDPTSAFGGVVGFNAPVTESTAQAMHGKLFDVIVAPAYDPNALKILKERKRTRILQISQLDEDVDAPAQSPPATLEIHSIANGILIQTADTLPDTEDDWRVVTKRQPTATELSDLRFAWQCCALTKSNAIVIAQNRATIGIGTGQPSRVGSVQTAIANASTAQNHLAQAALASDAFFPFPDGVELAARAGICTIIQPGGSIRDDEVIQTADQHQIAMLFTSKRHFSH